MMGLANAFSIEQYYKRRCHILVSFFKDGELQKNHLANFLNHMPALIPVVYTMRHSHLIWSSLASHLDLSSKLNAKFHDAPVHSEDC